MIQFFLLINDFNNLELLSVFGISLFNLLYILSYNFLLKINKFITINQFIKL